MNINEFDVKCFQILKNIKEEDGLYNYYKTRINNKKILCQDDELLISYFMENVDKTSNIMEIAAGIGQVGHYLNKNGFSNITINECDIKRMNIANLLNVGMCNTCKLIKNKYQVLNLNEFDYIFTLNGVSSHLGKLEDLSLFEEILNNGKKLILKEGYFGVHNNTQFTDKLKEKYKYDILFETDESIIYFTKYYRFICF
jgi:hypothetical protein